MRRPRVRAFAVYPDPSDGLITTYFLARRSLPEYLREPPLKENNCHETLLCGRYPFNWSPSLLRAQFAGAQVCRGPD